MKTSNVQMKTNRMLLVLGLALTGLCALPQKASAVVGYVNVPLTNGYNFVANPLDVLPNNHITNVIPSAPVNARIYLWNVATQVFQQVGVFDEATQSWVEPKYAGPCNALLPPGLGFVLWSPISHTNTFVGEVGSGGFTNFVAGNHKLSLLGSKPPLSGELAGVLGFPAINGADALTFSSASQSYSNTCTYFPGYGWYDPVGLATSGGPFISVARSFFVRNPGQDTNWIVSFTPGFAAPMAAGGKAGNAPEICGLALRDGTVTLNILNPGGTNFNVQFSTDRVNWSTLATGQTGTIWKGPAPPDPQGYFQLVNP